MFPFLSLALVTVCLKLVSAYFIVLTGDKNVIPGETVNFKAAVYEENNVLSPHKYTFNWKDDANPPHSATIEGVSPVYWNVTYELDTLPGIYNALVEVKKFVILIKTTVGTQTMQFNISKYISGEVVLKQGNVSRTKYVSNELAVNHTIALKESFLSFLNRTKNFMRVFWFIDCTYYGPQAGLEFDFNYTQVDTVHFVEALLVASYDPRLPKSHNIFTPPEAIIDLNNVTLNLQNKLVNVTNTTGNSIENSTREELLSKGIDKNLIEWLKNFNASQSKKLKMPKDYCLNSSIIPISSNYTYGFFKTTLTVKAPVKTSPINGTNWLMDGEVLNINVSCNGSSPYRFCILLKSGLYNVTGNETCREETLIKNCSFGIQHLFKKPSEYTLVVIISNAVSRVVKPIAVNIYKVKKHAQLSVIIVPVSFSLIATILIIFGVAYYVQSKHKYTIEVADFDFGNQTSNMEYKTFRERLRESISNSFLKSNDFQDDDSAWSESVPTSRKYGSME